VAFLRKPLAACGRLMNRSDVFLKDDVLSRGLPDNVREPSEVGCSPIGPAAGADIVAEQEGLETERGVFKVAESLFTCPAELTNGFICDLGHRDRGASPRAGQAGQVPRVSAVGCDPVARFLGHQRGRPHPAIVALLRQRAVEPIAARAGFVDAEQMLGLGLPLANQRIEGTLACAHRPARGPLGPMLLGHLGHRDGLFVDLHSKKECVRLRHG